MRVVADQLIAAPATSVQAALTDPAFYAALGSLPGISAPRLRSLDVDGDRAQLVASYHFNGELNGPARRVLDPAKLSWSQVSEVDLARRHTDLRMVPDNYAKLLSFSGWYELLDHGAGQCRQHLEADLGVHVPVLGALAERVLANGIRDNLAATARLLEKFLDAAEASDR